jgi:hypothetical protein
MALFEELQPTRNSPQTTATAIAINVRFMVHSSG